MAIATATEARELAARIRLAQALREGGHSQRCHTIPTLGDASVGKHSYNMLTLLHVLYPEARVELWRAILLHDVAERWVGDTPADAKYGISKALGKAVREAESRVEQDLGISEALSCLTEEELSWQKALDVLEFVMFCADQQALGNMNYEAAESNARAMLRAEWVPTRVKDFVEHYQWSRTRGMVRGEVLHGLDKGLR